MQARNCWDCHAARLSVLLAKRRTLRSMSSYSLARAASTRRERRCPLDTKHKWERLRPSFRATRLKILRVNLVRYVLAFIYPVQRRVGNVGCLRFPIVSLLTILVKGKVMDTDKIIPEGSIAEAISSLRESRGKTQAILSKELGVTRSRLAQWERDTYKPPAKVLLMLSEMAPESEKQWWRDQASARVGFDLERPESAIERKESETLDSEFMA